MLSKYQYFCAVVAVVFLAGCATSEPDQTIETEDEDVGVDAGEDAEVSDPCDACTDVEICIEDECVDACETTDTQCGPVEFRGEELECGECPLGHCNEGVCPSICEAAVAECGQLQFDGETHDCGECDGGEHCLANNQCTSGSSYIDVTAGRAHTCAVVASAGQPVHCWGRNDRGQLGNGDRADDEHEVFEEPKAVVGSGAVETISSLNHHTCAGTDDGLLCWGENEHGQLGDNSTDATDSSVSVRGVDGEYVIAGGEHSCAIDEDGQVVCWGRNDNGQLGAGDEETNIGRRVTVGRQGAADTPLEEIIDIGLGSAHSCVVDGDNQLWCWGYNRGGRLGVGDNHDGSTLAVAVDGLDESIVAVSSGFSHSCALGAAGRVWCWGEGDHGQVGDGAAEARTAPVEVYLPEPAVDVDAGRRHTCAVVESGEVHCWGSDEHGQAGEQTGADEVHVPQRVDGINRAVRVAAGGEHSCVLTDAGRISCWGRNDNGQLGDGSAISRP